MNFSLLTFWLHRAKVSRRKANKVLFFFCFFCVSILAAQLDSKVVRGKVVSSAKDVTGITIQNVTTEQATITNFEGDFSISASVGDTLVFSAVQLKRKVIPVTKTLYNSSFVQITMEEFINELKEVTVQPFGLSGDISKDVDRLELEKDVSAEALGLPNAGKRIPTQSERKLQEASKGAYSLKNPLAIGLNPIINSITGRTKMLKKRVAVDKKYKQTRQVQNSYADSIFQANLKIPKSKIADFMYFCEVDEEFQNLVTLGDQLQLWDYLLRRSKVYRENNGLD